MSPVIVMIRFTTKDDFRVPVLSELGSMDKLYETRKDVNIFVLKVDEDTIKARSGQRLLIVVGNNQKVSTEVSALATFSNKLYVN